MKWNWRKAMYSLMGMAMTCSITAMTVFAETTEETTDEEVSLVGTLVSSFALPVILLLALYFILIRPQQKADKEAKELLSNMQVGDEVVTIGGIVGIIMRIEEQTNTVIIETGSDRLKIRLKKDAIREDITRIEEQNREKAQRQKAKQNPQIKSE